MAAEVGTVARDNDDDTDDANAGQVAWFTQVNQLPLFDDLLALNMTEACFFLLLQVGYPVITNMSVLFMPFFGRFIDRELLVSTYVIFRRGFNTQALVPPLNHFVYNYV
jgi:hypothetical protein